MMKFCDSNEPKYGRVSILSFCDLAGSERIKKTQNDLKRQKETGNINTSLLVLGRVMKALRDNQYIKDLKKHSVVPFRDSKLTRLLQVFFKGLGQASMIVNISQAPYLFDETLQALKFAAITSKIKYVREFKTPKSKRRSTFSSILFEHKRTSNLFGRGSIAWENPIISSTIQHPQILNEETEEHEQEDESSLISNSCPDQFEALTDLVTQLRQRLNEEMDKNMTLETEIRSELCSKFDTMMLQNEQQWQKRLQESTDRIENLSSWRITQLENAYNECRKRKRYEQTDEDNSNRIATLETALDVKITELGESDKQFKAMKETYNSLLSVKQKLQEDLTFFKFENQSFKTRIQRLEDKNIALSQENKSKDLAIESMSTKPILIDLRNQLSDTKNKLSKKNEEVSYFKKLLDEAGEEFIAKDDELQKMTLDISSLRTECTKLTLALRDAQHEYSILISESNHRQEEKENLEEQVINFRTEVTELLAEKSNLILELSNLKKEKLTSGQKLERNVILKDSEENEKELNRRILKLEDENRTIKEDFELFKDKAELRIEDFQITLQNAMDTSEALLAKNNELKSKISLLESEVSVLGSLSSPCGKERQKDILPDMSVLETKEFENVEHKIITEELDNVRKVLEEKDTIIKTNNKSLSERDKEIEKVHARISELKCGLHKSDKEISSLNNKVEENASYIQQLENIIVDKDYEITLAEEKIANYEKKENERSSIDEKLSSTSEELKKTIKELDKYKIVNEELEKSLKKIHDERDRKEKDLNDEIESLRQSKVKIKASDDEKTKLLSDKELEISSLQKEVKHLIQTDVANRQMIDNQNSELKVLEVQIKKLNEETKDCKVLGKKIGEQQNQIDSLKNQLNSKEREENMIEILKEELDSKNLEKNKLLDKISQLESKVIDASQLSELQLKISHLEEEIHSKNEEIRQARNQREATMFTYSKAFKTKEEEISRLKQESTRIRDVIIRSSPTKNNVASSLKNELEKKGVTIKILEEQVQQSLDVNVETQENSLKSEIDSLKCQISRANNKHSREIEKIKRTNGKVIQEYKDANRELQKQIGLTSNISDDSLQKSMLEADESLNVSVEISSKIKTKKKGRVRSARKKSRISESSTLSPISSTSAKGNFDNNTEEGTEGDENIPYNTRNSSQITLSVRKPRRKYVNMEDNFKETPRKGRSTLKNVGNSDISIDNSIPIPTPRRSTRKTLYNPGKLEVFSPVQDLEESNSSPHTIVKRQLRARKKKLAS
uniref:Kinesinlike protein KIF20Blike [Aplysia californica] n=1 Tax=Lepeophtheirus salmonis TaxID=72036 RepID=A0A0K2TCN8_LEPSM